MHFHPQSFRDSDVKCEYLWSLVFLIPALCYLSEKLYLTKRGRAISSSIWSQWANKSSFRSQLFKAPTAHCLSVLGLLRSGKGGDYKEFQSIRHPLPPTLLNRVRKLAFWIRSELIKLFQTDAHTKWIHFCFSSSPWSKRSLYCICKIEIFQPCFL